MPHIVLGTHGNLLRGGMINISDGEIKLPRVGQALGNTGCWETADIF